MPAFTAIAAAIVSYVGGIGLAAAVGSFGISIITGVVATGLAMITSRLINGNPGGGGGGSQQAQGTRVQLQPDTTNKIPVVYGEGYFASMVTDAYLHDENKWMTYVMVIGETNNQQATFQGSISAATSRLTAVDIPEGDSGTLMLGMQLKNSAGAVVGVVEEFISGTYGGVGVYRVSGAVETSAQLLTGAFVYTVEDIYWNDERLVFENGAKSGKVASGKKYVDNLPYNPDTGAANTEDHTNDHYKDHVEVYVYAGSSQAVHQLGGGTADHAYKRVGTNGTAYEWTPPDQTGGQRMSGLIFAVIKEKYNSEKGFTGMPAMTFKIKCSLDNPAVALYDYMRSNRYGCGIGNGQINAAALGDFANYCNESVTYIPYGSTTPATQKRYTINGLIDTNRSCQDNIDTILMNAGAWMAYDVHTGQWRIIPKRAVETNATYPNRLLPAQLLRFTDDNIVGGIGISSTRLDNLYNIAEIEFYDRLTKDQRGFRSIEVNEGIRNYNEPDNAMRLTLDLSNSNVQAERVANLELKQSRDDMVVTFKTTHYGLQAQAGDVIQVESSLYGWQEPVFPLGKKFRVIQVKEEEGPEGGLFSEITALEYNADVYTDESISEFTTSANIGIIPRNSSVNIPAPIVVIDPNNINSKSGVPNFRLNIQIPSTGGPFDELQLWYAEGNDWAGTGGDFSGTGQAAGDKIYVTTWKGPNVIRSFLDSGVATIVSGKTIPADTQIQSFGADASPYYGNGQTGYYTMTNFIEQNTGLIPISGTITKTKVTASFSTTTKTMTVTGAGITPIDLQSLVQGGVESAQITSAKIVSKTLSVFALTGTITPSLPFGSTSTADPGTGTIITGDGILTNTRVRVQLTTTEPDGSYGKRGTYEITKTQGNARITEARGLYPNVLNDTVITAGPAGGGAGVYTINKQQNWDTSFTAEIKHGYPLPAAYNLLKSIKPSPDSTLLFNPLEIRNTFITELPANNENSKYFVKARLGINGIYGPYSELGEVDLEAPTVYWNPDGMSSLNIKTELTKMDFGKFTIPRNGLWLMRTATQLDGGRFGPINGDYFNLDLGNLEEEHVITSDEMIEEFKADPQAGL